MRDICSILELIKEEMMEFGENDLLTIDVGGRLRQLRQEQNLSMRALARESGLSTNALSMIERSKTSPSVSTLYKLSEALGIPITAFFRVEPPRQDVVFRKANEHTRIVFPQGMWYGLGGEAFTGRMESSLITLEHNGCSGPYDMIHSGNEFVFCISGVIEYTVENDIFTLHEGDSLIFNAQKKHRWCNPGQDDAKALVVLAEFEHGESPSEYHVSSGLKGSFYKEETNDDATEIKS